MLSLFSLTTARIPWKVIILQLNVCFAIFLELILLVCHILERLVLYPLLVIVMLHMEIVGIHIILSLDMGFF